MRSSKWLLIPTLAVTVAGTARAQVDFDALDVKPVIMLLVDTSGSMERMPGSETLPDCASPDPALKKNRWAITLETLTGSFDTFSCAEQNRSSAADGYSDADYDYGYYLNHYEFVDPERDGTFAAQTADDGILDVFKNRAKFGVMTFDGVGTVLGGEPLMDFATYNAAEADSDGIFGVQGMYSYGEAKKLVFPGCLTTYYVNAGARRPNEGAEDIPGALVSPGASDAAADILAVNAAVQNSLLRVRPFGGTPTAAMLDDLNYWFENAEDIREKENDASPGDSYYQCRDRYAVLITDGKPDAMFRDSRYECDTTPASACEAISGTDCTCPYDLEPTIVANQLIGSDKLKKLFVVAFDVDVDTRAELDAIALAGGSDEAYSASTPAALRDVLDNLMTSLSPNSATRATPVTVNSVSAISGSTQYELKAGFMKGVTDDEPWRGVLERRRIECDFSGPTPTVVPRDIDLDQGDRFDHELDNQSLPRAIYSLAGIADGTQRGTLLPPTGRLTDVTYLPGSSADATVAHDNSSPGDVGTDNPSASVQAASDTNAQVVSFVDLDETQLGIDAADLVRVREYIYGTSRTHKLADIAHSTPGVLPSLDTDTGTPLLDAYRRSLLDDPSEYRRERAPSITSSGYTLSDGRPAVVFVGTNDGVLHAFNLDTWTSGSGSTYPAGHEFWGFIPPALFSKLDEASLPSHQDMFDGEPLVADVVLRRNLTTVSETPEMATVLVAPIRGAQGFVALDVTLPDQPPTFMWQISDENMGNTVGAPAIAHVDVRVGGEIHRRAVAILPGGEGALVNATNTHPRGVAEATAPANARANGRDWRTTGRVLLVVDIGSGQILRKFDARFFTAPLTGSVAVDEVELERSQRAYFSDEDGVLWRLSMTSHDIDKWLVEPIFDMFAGESALKGAPSTYPPIVTRNAASQTVILAGTGSLDNTTDATARNYVVSLTEESPTLVNDIYRATIAPNWVLPLEAGELVTGRLSLLGTTVYFGSFVASSGGAQNLCSGGTSRLWGLNWSEVDAGDGKPLAALEDGGSLVRYIDPTANDGDPSNDGKLVLGVSVTRTPICVQATVENNAVTGTRMVRESEVGGGTFMVRGLISGGSSTNSSGTQISQVEKSLSLARVADVVSSAGAIE